jgi:hypothetical protein
LLVGVLAGCHSSGGQGGAGPDGSTGSGSGSASGSGVTGTWLGAITIADASAPIEFGITENSGVLGGVQVLFDPSSSAPVKAGPINGAVVGGTAQWSTLGDGLEITGTFDASAFSGTANFPNTNQATGPLAASIALTRVDGGTP